MTAIMVSPVLYRCDGKGCRAEVDGTTARLPTGWVEWGTTRVVVKGTGEKLDEWVGHLCRKCQPPEAT